MLSGIAIRKHLDRFGIKAQGEVKPRVSARTLQDHLDVT